MSPADTHRKQRYPPPAHVQKVSTHETILQLLNRKVGEDFYGVEPFAQSVDEWSGIPVIFATAHPDLDDYTADPEKELAHIAETTGTRAEIVGQVTDPIVETAGHPRLMGTLVLNEDDEIDELLDAGRLSVSTAFYCADDGKGNLTGPVRPHHVLIFEEDEQNQPVDRGAVILNKKETTVTSHTNSGRIISEKNKSEFKAALDTLMALFKRMAGDEQKANAETTEIVAAPANGFVKPADTSLEGQIEVVRRALSESVGLRYADGTPRRVWVVMTLPDSVIWQHPDTEQYYQTPYSISGDEVAFEPPTEIEQAFVVKKTNMTADDLAEIARRNSMAENTPAAATPDPRDTEIAALKEQNAAMQEQIAGFERAQKESAWAQMKNRLPPGMTHTPEAEKESRSLFEKDPVAFANKILDLKTAAPTPEEGDQYTNKGENDPVAIARELRQSTGRMR